jgi:hypothetical protein
MNCPTAELAGALRSIDLTKNIPDLITAGDQWVIKCSGRGSLVGRYNPQRKLEYVTVMVLTILKDQPPHRRKCGQQLKGHVEF